MTLNQNMQVKRILVVGLGSIGKRHIQVIQNLYPKMTIAVLRHRLCDKKEIELAGVDCCFTHIDDAISFKPHAAVIANPATKHLDVAIKLAESGVPLLIEKPISSDISGVQKLINIGIKNHVILMTAYNLRFLPSLIAFKNILAQGKIGQIYSVRAEVGQYLPEWRAGLDYRQSVSAQKKLGGGVLLELSHEIDYLLWLFGAIDWVSGYVSLQSHLEIDVEDTAYVIIGFKSKTTGQQLTASLNMDFIRHDTSRKCEVIGELGSLRWDAVIGKVECFSRGEKDWKLLYSEQPERNHTYIEQMKDFILCVETGTAPRVSAIDGIDTLAVIDAVRKSSDSGKRIFVEKCSQ